MSPFVPDYFRSSKPADTRGMDNVVLRAPKPKQPKAPRVPDTHKLFWEPNLSVWIRAQPSARTYSVAIAYNGESVFESTAAKSRQEAEQRAKEGLSSLRLSMDNVDTLIELLDLDAKSKILRGTDYPSSTIHVVVG